MFKSRVFSIFALSAILATGAFFSFGTANAALGCHTDLECQNDGLRPPHRGNDGTGGRNSNDSQSMNWRRNHHGDYSNNGVGFGIYLNDGYGDGYGHGYGYDDGYGYNDGYGDDYAWRHHRHCRTVKIWRHHHPVWVKRCY